MCSSPHWSFNVLSQTILKLHMKLPGQIEVILLLSKWKGPLESKWWHNITLTHKVILTPAPLEVTGEFSHDENNHSSPDLLEFTFYIVVLVWIETPSCLVHTQKTFQWTSLEVSSLDALTTLTDSFDQESVKVVLDIFSLSRTSFFQLRFFTTESSVCLVWQLL